MVTSPDTGAPPAPDLVQSVAAEIAAALAEFQERDDITALHARLTAAIVDVPVAALARAAEPYRDVPPVAAVLYERIVAERPDDAGALVRLGNAWWLAGRGPEPVGALAARALAADPMHRGAWHLWALSEPHPRERTARWQQVVERFPGDDLARAALADNAASLAGAERDPEALALAIGTYEDLWARSPNAEQRAALERALATLRGWRL